MRRIQPLRERFRRSGEGPRSGAKRRPQSIVARLRARSFSSSTLNQSQERVASMCGIVRSAVGLIAVILLFSNPLSRVFADESKEKSPEPTTKKSDVTSRRDVKAPEDVPEMDLLEASRQGLVSVQAEGRGDGRMTVSVTNRTKRQLRVVLPPGLIAQGATGQFGGMGGMGGMMGGMGGGMGGMGGGMGGMDGRHGWRHGRHAWRHDGWHGWHGPHVGNDARR